MIVKRVGALSCAKVAGAIYALGGLLMGAVFSAVNMVHSFTDNFGFPASAIGPLLGLGAVVVMPIFYGLIGFISALIGASLYNLIAGWVGGIEVDIQ